jgi:hypothetical protein
VDTTDSTIITSKTSSEFNLGITGSTLSAELNFSVESTETIIQTSSSLSTNQTISNTSVFSKNTEFNVDTTTLLIEMSSKSQIISIDATD